MLPVSRGSCVTKTSDSGSQYCKRVGGGVQPPSTPNSYLPQKQTQKIFKTLVFPLFWLDHCQQTNRLMDQWTEGQMDIASYRVFQVSCNIKNWYISASKGIIQFLKKNLINPGPRFCILKFHYGWTVCWATTYGWSLCMTLVFNYDQNEKDSYSKIKYSKNFYIPIRTSKLNSSLLVIEHQISDTAKKSEFKKR